MKTTLLMLLMCPLIATAMDNGSLSGTNSPSSRFSRNQSNTSLAMEEYENQARPGSPTRYIRLQQKSTRNIANNRCNSALKKSVIGTTGVGILILAGIGAWTLYSTFSEQVGEMKASCLTCSENLQNVSVQAQAATATCAGATSTVARLNTIMNLAQPLLATCNTTLTRLLIAIATACGGNG